MCYVIAIAFAVNNHWLQCIANSNTIYCRVLRRMLGCLTTECQNYILRSRSRYHPGKYCNCRILKDDHPCDFKKHLVRNQPVISIVLRPNCSVPNDTPHSYGRIDLYQGMYIIHGCYSSLHVICMFYKMRVNNTPQMYCWHAHLDRPEDFWKVPLVGLLHA